MTRAEWREAVLALPVWDTHTHLVGGKLAATSFWDIGEYFWLLRELRGAGYPAHPEELPEADRRAAYAAALANCRNTSMAWVLRRIFRDLYDLELTSAAALAAADEAVRARSGEAGWPAAVAARGGVRRAVTNVPADQPYPDAPGLALCLPRLEGQLTRHLANLRAASDQRAALATVQADLNRLLADYRAAGYPGVMTSESPFGYLHAPLGLIPPELPRTGASEDDLSAAVLHALCHAAEEAGLRVQFFLGVEHLEAGGAAPVGRPDRVVNRYGLFRAYDVEFDLVAGSALNNLDIVQAARIHPHVHAGGLWWYNFRASSYQQVMQQRLEALAPGRCALVASDARCIDWCYGKIILVKTLLADFLADQADRGWIDDETGLFVATEWLHDAPRRLYEGG